MKLQNVKTLLELSAHFVDNFSRNFKTCSRNTLRNTKQDYIKVVTKSNVVK